MSALARSSALSKTFQRVASRGMGGGMGGGGHANDPVFTFQANWSKNKYKGFVFSFGLFSLGCYVPYKLCDFAQKKAGVAW